MQLIHDYINAILIRNFNLVFVHVNLFMVDLLLFFLFLTLDSETNLEFVAHVDIFFVENSLQWKRT